MKTTLKILVPILIVGIVLFAMNAKKGDQVTEVTIDKASRGDITSIVTATGKVYPEVEVRISSEVAGEIVELPVKDGDAVAKGDLLVRVNPITLEAQVAQQEAALRANQSNSYEAKARMLQAELDLKRQRSLAEKGFTSPDQVQEAETQFEISKASYQATLSRIEQQEMSLKEARDTLAKATTYSPIDGTITALKSELGDRVVGTGQFEGTEILRVANLKEIEVRVDVSEADIVSVKIGDTATIDVESLPDQQFEGVVSEIANSAANSDSNQQNSQELTTFEVKVKFLSPSDQIRPGMTATAEIKTKTVTDVVKVPLQSVTVRARDVVAQQLGEKKDEATDDASTEKSGEEEPKKKPGKFDNLERVVFLFQDGKAILRRVETGIADNKFIEIKSGLCDGDEIITGSYRALTRELSHDMVVKKEEPKKGGPGSEPWNKK